MKVSKKVKSAYGKGDAAKHLVLWFPELNKEVSGAAIHSESLKLSEKLVVSKSIEFVGCNASKFSIKVQDLKEDVKGKKITVEIYTDGTKDEPVTLFNGIVDDAKKKSNKRVKEIIAYDELYTKGQIDVSAWYKSLPSEFTLKYARDSLFEYIGLEQAEIDLPNDNIVIKKQYDPSTLQTLPVIKAFCQINGVFGIINRQGDFEYRILRSINIDDGLYPGFYPGEDAIPGVSLGALGLDNIDTTDFSFYKDVDYKEYNVKPVDKITIRQSEDDDGITYGDGTNNYIIQGNMFAYGLSKDVLLQVAENIYPNVQGFSYIPFTSQNNGLPFLECGLDAASYMMLDFEEMEKTGNIVYEPKSFYILNRELSGIQALKDSYSAEGEEYQTEFITDLQTQIDILKKSGGADKQYVQDYVDNYVPEYVEGYTYDKEYINNRFENFEGGSKWESVDVLPNIPDSNTWYAIQGKVIIE